MCVCFFCKTRFWYEMAVITSDSDAVRTIRIVSSRRIRWQKMSGSARKREKKSK